MKCPKCGFQSFNSLASCKKCGRDLSELRDRYRLGDPVLPRHHASPPAGLVPPVVEDPFETILPDEKEISCTAKLAVLPDEEVDAELADYFDEINAIDPELAATLDPDTDWTDNALTMESFGLGEDSAAEPVLSEQEPVFEVAPNKEDFVTDVEPEEDAFFTDVEPDNEAFATDVEPTPEAVPLPVMAGWAEEIDAQSDDFEAMLPLSDEDFLAEDDASLDDWLLDGDEPSWRRAAAAISAEEVKDFLPADSDDARLGAINDPDLSDDQADIGVSEQAPLPFESDPAASVQRAPLVGRLLAMLLDTGLLAATLALFVLAGEYLRRGQGVFTWPQPQDLSAQAGPYFLVFFGLAFGYFTMFHYLGGQTPGKMASKLLVVDLDGEPLQLSQAFLRSVGGLVCLLPAGLGFCSALFNREGRGWNDRLAGSVVVSGREEEREELD